MVGDAELAPHYKRLYRRRDTHSLVNAGRTDEGNRLWKSRHRRVNGDFA